MVQAMDVLRESADISKSLGMALFANAGLTACYPGTDLEDRISKEHPEWRKEGSLLFGLTETRAYASALVQELVQWGADGVSIDCMRYPQHQEEEDLVELFRAFHRAVSETSQGREIPIAARIPAGDVVYYRAFERLAREGCVQRVIPSNLWQRKPKFSLAPYVSWKKLGCSVYGLIDGWKEGLWGNEATSLLPREVDSDIRSALREGADGIFVYQADGYCANPFTRNALDWRRHGS